MKFVLVARDVGPSKSLDIIAGTLRVRGHTATAFLGEGKPFPDKLPQMSKELRAADCLVVGISSSTERVTEEKFAYSEAKRLDVPIAVFCDNYGTYHRLWWMMGDNFSNSPNSIFVLDESEVSAAKMYVADDTHIIATGNPYWETFFKVPLPCNEVRDRLGIKPEEKMLLAIGSKELERNVPLFTDLVLMAREQEEDERVRVILTMHPGADHGEEVYSNLLRWCNCVRFAPSSQAMVSTQALITGSDIVVTSGGSSVGIMAICQRKPVIDLMHPIDDLWWKELSGLDFWPPAEYDASYYAIDGDDLGAGVSRILDSEDWLRQEMNDAQEEHFSLSAFKNATDAIVAELET